MDSFKQHITEAKHHGMEGHKGHVLIGKREHEKLKKGLGEPGVTRTPKGTMGHGRAIYVYTHGDYTSTNYYAHADHGRPSTWEHYNRKTGKRTYTKHEAGE